MINHCDAAQERRICARFSEEHSTCRDERGDGWYAGAVIGYRAGSSGRKGWAEVAFDHQPANSNNSSGKSNGKHDEGAEAPAMVTEERSSSKRRKKESAKASLRAAAGGAGGGGAGAGAKAFKHEVLLIMEEHGLTKTWVWEEELLAAAPTAAAINSR